MGMQLEQAYENHSISHCSFLIAGKVDVDDDVERGVVRALLIASFIAAIRCEEDYRLYIQTALAMAI